MRTEKGFQTQVVWGLITTLLELKERYPDDQIIILNDGHADFRFEIYPEYKGNRKAKSPADEKKFEAYKAQSPYLKRVFASLGIPSLLCLNLEADDLASFLVTKRAGRRVVLITSDRDWLLMLRDGVDWFDIRKDVYITERNLSAKTGVFSVNQFLTKKALMGDSSDNISGVGGFGEKRATDFALKYGDLESFLAKASLGTETLSSFEKKLLNDASMQSIYRRNLKLMDIRERQTLDKSKLVRIDGRYDENAFLDVCEELELRTFFNKIAEIRRKFNEQGHS